MNTRNNTRSYWSIIKNHKLELTLNIIIGFILVSFIYLSLSLELDLMSIVFTILLIVYLLNIFDLFNREDTDK